MMNIPLRHTQLDAILWSNAATRKGCSQVHESIK